MLTLTENAHAQVEWKDRPATLAQYDQMNPAVAKPHNADFTIIVWEHEREDAGNIVVDIFAQKIDNATGVTLWAPDGVPVCTAENDQRNPRAAFDSTGGVYIVWEDYRDDATNQEADIYIQRLNVTNGSVSNGWTTNGELLSHSDYHAERSRLVGTRNGAFVVWVDWRNSGSPQNRDIYAQFIKDDASIVWTSNGLAVSNNNADQTNAEIDRDWIWVTSNNVTQTGVWIVFQDKRNQSATTSQPIWTLYAVNIDADGNVGQEVRVANVNEEQVDPQIVVTGRPVNRTINDAVIIWHDYRNKTQTDKGDIWAQRIDASGNPQWGSGAGIPICDYGYTQNIPAITLWELTNLTSLYNPYVAVGWSDFRGASGQLFGALLDVDAGSVISPNGTTGEVLCTTQNDPLQFAIDNIGVDIDSAVVYYVWREWNGNEYNISYQAVGLPYWTLLKQSNGWIVTEVKEDQGKPQISGNVFVFEDPRRNPIGVSGIYSDGNDDLNIFAQTPGECVGPKEMKWRDFFVQWSQGTDAANMRFVVDRLDQSTFIVWDQDDNGDRAVFIQKFDKYGIPRWQNNGIRLSESGWNAEYPDVVTDRAGGAQVVWQQYETANQEKIRYTHVSADGSFSNPQAFGPNERQLRPVCVENFAHAPATPLTVGMHGAIIACLIDDGTDVKRAVIGMTMGLTGNLNLQIAGNINVEEHELLKIANDHIGGSYLMSMGYDPNSSEYAINFTWVFETGIGAYAFDQNETIKFDSFGGFDIMTDVFPPVTQGDPYQANAVYAIDGANQYRQVHGTRIDGLNMNTIVPVAISFYTNGWDATNPSLDTDNILFDDYGGYVVAWNLQYPHPISGQPRHAVRTNHIVYWNTGSWPPIGLIGYEYTLDADRLSATHPVISHSTNVGQFDSPTAFVVWESVTEECSPSPSLEIIGQYVIYDGTGPQWTSPSTRRVSPGTGSYTQSLPLVKKSGEDAVVFWLDSKTGDQCVMGTTMYDDQSDINWRKRTIPSSNEFAAKHIALDQSYPNPLSLSNNSVVVFSFSVQEEQYVSLRLFDLLGREVATIFDGFANSGRHLKQFIPVHNGLSLAPGLYRYVLTSGQKIQSRSLVIVK